MKTPGINPLMIYGVLGVAALGLTYLIVTKVGSGVSNLFGMKGSKEKEKELDAIRKQLAKMKIDWKRKFSLGKSKEAILGKANAYATLLYTNLRGYTDEKEGALIMAIFQKLKYKMDVRLVVKRFGVREGQDLSGWIMSETMSERRKSYILTKIAEAVA